MLPSAGDGVNNVQIENLSQIFPILRIKAYEQMVDTDSELNCQVFAAIIFPYCYSVVDCSKWASQ